MEFSHDVFLRHIAQTTGQPFLIDIEKAEGLYLYGPDGKKYMDLISGVAVSNIGHRHPHVIAAIKDQLDRHLHVMVYGEYVQSAPNLLAKRLAEALPDTLNCTYFVNSGAEANEGALKLAKRYTGRTEIIACHKSYHGSTHGALSVSGNEVKKSAFRPLLPDVRFIHFNCQEDLAHITEKTACVIIETVQGDAGVRIPDKKYLQALRRRCTDMGTLLVFDEIQTGFGRTGTLFAFEQFGVVPDILTLAKAMGGGLPIGAFIADRAMMNTLTFEPMLGHITTFGGNPVCCAASLATLEVLLESGFLDGVESKGQLFEKYLQHEKIVEIRRIGLMFAIEFDCFETVASIVTDCLEQGVICFWFLSTNNSFRIAPPLTISPEEVKEACDIILAAIDKA